MKLSLFFLLTVLSVTSLFAQNGNIKFPNIVLERDSRIPVETEARRKRIIEVINTYFDRYNSEFRKLNNVSFEAVNGATRAAWVRNVSKMSAMEMSQDPELVLIMLKKNSDEIAKIEYTRQAKFQEAMTSNVSATSSPTQSSSAFSNESENQELKKKFEQLSAKYENLEKQNQDILNTMKQVAAKSEGQSSFAQEGASQDSTKMYIFIGLILLTGFFIWSKRKG